MAMSSTHSITWLDTIDSTNNEVKRKIDVLDNLSVLAAREQTEGRGQRGNVWLTEPGMNLTFSILLKYDQMQVRMKAEDQFEISELTAMSVIGLLAQYGIEARIKLPNDIYVGDKKICGILIEHALHGEHISHTIIGVGLNVNQLAFDPSLPNPTSMLQCLSNTPEQLNLTNLLEQFMNIFCQYLQKITLVNL